MAYQAETGRLPGRAAAVVPRVGPGRAGRGGREAARQGARLDPPGGGRHPRPPVRGHARLSRLRLLRLPRHLPCERGQMIDGIEAITFDFGNTLVPFPAGPDGDVVRRDRRAGGRASSAVRARRIRRAPGARSDAASSPRTCPQGREADMDVRVARVLARLRGRPAPATGVRWDDTSIASSSEPREVESDPRDATPMPSSGTRRCRRAIGPMLERLARHLPSGRHVELAARAVDRSVPRGRRLAGHFARGRGVCSGSASSSHARRSSRRRPRELGVASGPAILHVGDDPGADVVGAHRVGWRTAWVRIKPEDSPLPMAPPAPDARPDLTIDSVSGSRGGARPARPCPAK